MEKDKLLEKFNEKFVEMKEELKVNSTLEQLDKAFFIKDAIMRDGFLSQKLSRQISHRIVENFMSWNDYLHSLIMPNPQNLLNMGESKIFGADEKKQITELMKIAMERSSRNSVIGLKRLKNEEGKFIDDSLKMWEESFRIKISEIMAKVNDEWGKEK